MSSTPFLSWGLGIVWIWKMITTSFSQHGDLNIITIFSFWVARSSFLSKVISTKPDIRFANIHTIPLISCGYPAIFRPISTVRILGFQLWSPARKTGLQHSHKTSDFPFIGRLLYPAPQYFCIFINISNLCSWCIPLTNILFPLSPVSLFPFEKPLE